MDKNQLIQRLMATFLEELADHVRTLNQDLLVLEKDPPPAQRAERLQSLFRTAHSLKGAARSVSAGVIESACHQLEEILAAARDEAAPLTPERFELLFATADAIEEAGMRLREQHDLTGSPLAALLPRLETALVQDRETRRQGDKEKEREESARAVQDPALPVSLSPCLPVPEEAASVRVPAEKLDTLLARVGELLVARRRVESRVDDLAAIREFVGYCKTEWQRGAKSFEKLLQQPNGTVPTLPRRAVQALGQTGDNFRRLEKELDHLLADLARDGRFLKRVAAPLNEEVRRVRMLPFAEACQGLGRLVRDLAQAAGKEVELVIEGGPVELDRSILEGLKDPLRHLVRNAVDHGAELPNQRRAASKPARARIGIAAALRGSQVEVVVEDDGRGLDLEALREQARKRKLPEPSDERELARLIFLPGLSTAQLITDVSGRGVGLDVVKSRVESLHGTIDLTSTAGRGTRFTLTVPLTLTTLRAVLVTVGEQTYAFAGTNVQKLVRAAPADLRSVAGKQMLSLDGVPLPLASLAAVLGLNSQTAARPNGKMPVLVVAAGEKKMAFAVDEFVAEQEVVIKGLGARLRRLRYVSGATLLPSGRIALVLNAASLVRAALGRPTPLPLPEAAETPAPVRKRLLVVDDSVTTRTLEKSILEAAGYDVATAAEGQAAWQLLQEQGADLLVADVEMPRMDGLALTQAVRASPRWRELPVVLVTARESEQDRTRGLEVGADAYLVKSAFDQRNLLETIAQLL
jgi:two-component system chemotaxis sensor kinase CheA